MIYSIIKEVSIHKELNQNHENDMEINQKILESRFKAHKFPKNLCHSKCTYYIPT
jgi:hypothetical protein